jgi:type II secretory pathway predicted ATPase ExeA
MYLDYWGFRETPFVNVPSRDVFFESPQHQEAVNRLLYVINNRKGVAMLTGEVGSGKTTVIRNLTAYLPKGQYEVRMIPNPALTATDMVRSILIQFGLALKNETKSIIIEQLRLKLEYFAERGGGAVLVVDEAHVINRKSVLEELRMLLNLQSEDRFLLTLIMVGQPPLLKKIELLQPLKERISMKYHLSPLSQRQMEQYIRYRLDHVGAGLNIFTDDAMPLIFEYSNGIPLRINNLCDRCFLMGMMRKTQQVDAEIVRRAVADLE